MTPRIGVVGATGYVGAELVRLLLRRRDVTLACVASSRFAGHPLADHVPALAGCTDLVLRPLEPDVLADLDAVLLATPHGTARGLAAEIAQVPVLIDLSADHRHAPGWVYGQPEWHGPQLRGATRIAVPGCFATAVALATAPLVAAGRVRGPIRVAAATGSTGSGAAPSQAAHHPDRFANLRAYEVLRHRHVPEIRAFLSGLGEAPDLCFVPISAPLDRGIFATCFLEVGEDDPLPLYHAAYDAAPGVRLRAGSPEVRHVRGTGFCDLAVHHRGTEAVVLAAIDNLGRGAAAQALQCLELALGLPPAPLA